MTDLPVTLEMALQSGQSITTAESAKTGMETTQPVTPRAHSSLPLPTALMKLTARRSAAPDFSRMAPIMTPRPMMMPVLDRVLPKPVVMALMTPTMVFPSAALTVTIGMPPIMPVIRAAKSIAMKLWTLVLATKMIMVMMPRLKPRSIRVDSAIF